MAVREILKMGDPRLLRVAPPVSEFGSPELHALVADLFDTMEAANGAGLAAPQIGVDLQVVIFGFASNERYPDALPVPRSPGTDRQPSQPSSSSSESGVMTGLTSTVRGTGGASG